MTIHATPRTIGDALYQGKTIRVYCRGGAGHAMKRRRPCIAQIDVDLATLVWTRGRDFEIQHLASRMKCIHCGSRLIEVQVDPMS